MSSYPLMLDGDRLEAVVIGAGAVGTRKALALLDAGVSPPDVGYQFAAVGSIIYKHAKEKGIGQELPTDWFTQKEIP